MASHNTTTSSNSGDDQSEGSGSGMGELSVLRLRKERPCEERPQSHVMIDTLPDNVLLEIFDFYRRDPTSHIYNGFTTSNAWRWKTLTQVCRRWQHVIFESPRRLELQIVCTDATPARTSLDLWPPFPISVTCLAGRWRRVDGKGVENLSAALERRDRICQIFIDGIHGSALEKLVAVMQEPLPTLRYFSLSTVDQYDQSVPVLPGTFLGGSAPLLELFVLSGISFPTFPKFVLSLTHIVYLHLFDVPTSGYVSSDVMVTCLTALPKLESLSIEFRSRLSLPLQSNPHPLTRAVLPALTRLSFGGSSNYFEDFVARIDTPLLKHLLVSFFMDPIFDLPRLHNFIDRTGTLGPFDRTVMTFSRQAVKVILGSPTRFKLAIKCTERGQQLVSMTQIFIQQMPLLSRVEQLELCELRWEHLHDLDTDFLQWLELFRLFVAVRSLYVSEELVYPVTAALHELTGERTMEVLPALQNLSLEGIRPSGFVQEVMESFLAARQLSGHPIAIRSWNRQLTSDSESDDD